MLGLYVGSFLGSDVGSENSLGHLCSVRCRVVSGGCRVAQGYGVEILAVVKKM